MKNPNFHSCLAKRMEKFVALRRLAGTDYQSQIKLLKYFDDFLFKKQLNSQYLTRDIIDRYLCTVSYLHKRTQYNRFSVLSQFCRYLSQFEPLCYIPQTIHCAKSASSRIPYIYTNDEIQALLREAAELLPQNSLRPRTYRTLFGLLYTTGLRISEALALNIKDFYPDTKRLYIRQGKFHKARWIPLASSTSQMLEKYIDIRQRTASIASDSPLFVSLRHQRLHYSTVYHTFRSLLRQCHIPINKNSSVRIHDLRHTFAVHRLLLWYCDGQDITPDYRP